MDIKIKSLADSGDLKSLKYIFVDSLDVDPTFARYEEEYNYCKSIPGLLEAHVELTPFVQDSARWDENYWTKLKMDLVKNFSDIRMTHMREVAKVFLSEKYQRILTERAVAAKSKPLNSDKKVNVEPQKTVSQKQVSSDKTVSFKQAEERRLLEERRKLEQDNQRIEAEKRAEKKRIEERQRHLAEQGRQNQSKDIEKQPKKVTGIVIAAVVVIIIVIILLLKISNPSDVEALIAFRRLLV